MSYTNLFELPNVFPALVIHLVPRRNIQAQHLITVIDCGNCVGDWWERLERELIIHIISSGGKRVGFGIRQSSQLWFSLLEFFFVHKLRIIPIVYSCEEKMQVGLYMKHTVQSLTWSKVSIFHFPFIRIARDPCARHWPRD